MDYAKWITVPANTPESSPQKTTFLMWSGVIHQVRIKFPSGQEGTARCKIFQGSLQLWPTYRGEYYAGDGGGETFAEWHELEPGLNFLDVYTWNLDTLHDHEIFVAFRVLPKEALNPQRTFFKHFEKFLERLGV